MDALTNVQGIAASSAMELWSFVLNFLVFLIIAAVLFFFSMHKGRGAFLSLISAFYVGFAVYTVFPYTTLITAAGTGAMATTVSSIVLYMVFTGIAYYIIRKSSDGAFLTMGNAGVLILALLTSGFLVALSYHTFAIHELYRYSPAMETYFTPAKYFFWWFIAPLVGLIGLAR